MYTANIRTSAPVQSHVESLEHGDVFIVEVCSDGYNIRSDGRYMMWVRSTDGSRLECRAIDLNTGFSFPDVRLTSENVKSVSLQARQASESAFSYMASLAQTIVHANTKIDKICHALKGAIR